MHATAKDTSTSEDAEIPLPLKLKEFRKRNGFSIQALADRLGTPAYTVRRWETGTSKPSRAAADALETIGFGPLTDSDTNLSSRSRIRTAQSDSDGVRIPFRLNLAALPNATMPSWVVNGPPDQNDFHKRLVRLQVESARPVRLHQLSLIAEYENGIKTSQNLLECPKPTAASWNSNYGSHGWHRYVGRFPPHVVRALLNHFGAGSDSLVCDPFSGSGTTAVECRLLGIPFVGIEIGALSHLIATVKAGFDADPSKLLKLAEDYRCFFNRVVPAFRARHNRGFSVEDVLRRPGNLIPSFVNIEKWFTPEAFLGVSVTVEFAREQPGYLGDALLVALSAKMRSIGNVDVDVVRAEYSKRPREGVDVLKLVSNQLRKMASNIKSMVRTHPEIGLEDSIRLIEGSALSVHLPENSVDCVITSPPYGVEALSYLRTHLLSYRSLASELGHDPYETRDETVGSEYLEESVLPPVLDVSHASPEFEQFFSLGATELDKKMRQRRAGMMKFFEDMHFMGKSMACWLKDRGRVAFIVGNKRLGDRVIPTDKIIIESFQASGLHLYDVIRHKLKTNNSNSQVPWQERIIQEEAILLFERAVRE